MGAAFAIRMVWIALIGVAGCSRTAPGDDTIDVIPRVPAPAACEGTSAPPEGEWIAFATGSGTPWSRSVATDAWGGIAVAGSFYGEMNLSGEPLVAHGDSDAFLGKLTSSGEAAWQLALGGTGHDSGDAVDFAPDGSVLFAGSFSSSDVGLQGLPRDFAGGGVVVKFDACGHVLWSRSFFGVEVGHPLRLAVDATGVVYVAGTFQDRLRVDGDANDERAAGASDGFVAKLGADGKLGWTRVVGGPDEDVLDDVSVDPRADLVYVSSTVRGPFEVGATRVSGISVLIEYLTPDGEVASARTIGPAKPGEPGAASLSRVAACPNGVVVSADIEGSVLIGDLELTSMSHNDSLVSAFDRKGGSLWSRVIRDGAQPALAVDTAGRTFAAGWALGFLTIGNHQLTTHGDFDVFLATLDDQGAPISVESFGGSATDGSTDIAVDHSGTAVVTGVFGSQFTMDSFRLAPVPADGMNTFVLRRGPKTH